MIVMVCKCSISKSIEEVRVVAWSSGGFGISDSEVFGSS
jgi:hypothetical protein